MLPTDLVRAIDDRVTSGERNVHQVGTVVEILGEGDALVVFDGSQGSIPVKVAGNVDAESGDRVLLAKFGVWWIVVGTMRTVHDGGALIRETVLQQATATVSITAIPQVYKHLLFVVHARSDAGGTSAIDTTIRINGDSGAHYSGGHLDLPMGGALGVATGHDLTGGGTFMIPPNGVSSAVAGGGFMWLVDYTSTLWRAKQWFTVSAATDFGTAGDHRFRWNTWCPVTPVAITQIDLTCATGSFMTGSYFGLYGQGT